jgi:beta-glucosidase
MSDQLQAELHFPPGFLWGTSTAAHQVEGGNHNDWTAWEDMGGGRIFEDQVSGAACEWWSGRAEEDFDRAAGMHNNALRLSVEWSRVEPEPGRWDDAALARYRAMIEGLRARGLEPMVTLHHFTNPIWFTERGGWASEEAPRLFAQYARKVADALGDLVTLWCTINEPMVYATQGFLQGYFPPGKQDLGLTLKVATNLARGHAAAYHAIKPDHPTAQIGLAKHQISFVGYTPILGHFGAWLLNYLFNEAFFGAFSRGQIRWLSARPEAIPGGLGTLDWVGLQYYNRYHIRVNLTKPEMLYLENFVPDGLPHGPDGWGELLPEESLPRIKHLYKLTGCPIYVTEMGVPDIDDSIRPGYLARTLRSVWQACMHNMPVKGFFFWSLVDNFEWAEGYDPRFRFGLYGMDYATQARTERRSARLYRAICAENALTAAIVREHAPEALDKVFPQPAVAAQG